MKFLKNLALSLLSFLLFLSLSLFGLVFTLNKTLLNPDFVTAELNRLDVSSLVGELFTLQASPEAPYQTEVLEKTINQTITDLEPWLKQQLSTATYTSYDYLLGRSPHLNLVISLEPVKESLRGNLRAAFLVSLPPELNGLPAPVIEGYFNELYQQLAENIPSEFTTSSLPPDVLALLAQLRQAVSYFQPLYLVLIGLMLLLVLGIILIIRQVKETARYLGVPLLSYGALGYISILVTKYFSGTGLPLPAMPAALKAWLPQFINNLIAPMETFSLALLISGIALIIVSFVYKSGQPSS